MGVSVICFAAHTLLIKHMSVAHGISAWQSLWFRFLVGVLVTAMVFGPKGELRALRVVHRKLLIYRGLLGVVGTAFFYLTIPKLGAGISTLLSCAYVIISILLATWFLKEGLSMERLLWIALTFVGLAVLSGTGDSSTADANPWYFVLAFGGAVIAGFVIIIVRKLHQSENTPTIFWAQCSWGVVLALPTLLLTWRDPTPMGWGLLFLCGFLSALGQLAMTDGFRLLSVGMGAGFQMALPVLATLGGVAFLDESLTAWQMVAAVLIVFGTWRTIVAKSA